MGQLLIYYTVSVSVISIDVVFVKHNKKEETVLPDAVPATAATTAAPPAREAEAAAEEAVTKEKIMKQIILIIFLFETKLHNFAFFYQ
ncbi:MAG: hypothetical protein WCC17_00825 [Candidatus Nitrosopolaris sp.]